MTGLERGVFYPANPPLPQYMNSFGWVLTVLANLIAALTIFVPTLSRLQHLGTDTVIQGRGVYRHIRFQSRGHVAVKLNLVSNLLFLTRYLPVVDMMVPLYTS